MPEKPDLSVVVKGGIIAGSAGGSTDVGIGPDGTIRAVGADLEAKRVIDAAGCVVLPGLVDLHTHLREPGGEDAETILTGARCAVRGGFTGIVAMPNTTPTVDTAAVVRQVIDAGAAAPCEVATSAAITVGRAGETLAPMAELAELGVRIFTDDGTGVQDAGMMRRAMEYAAGLGVILAQHCEDSALAAGGHMHEGAVSSRLGIAGQPSEAEEAMVQRDLALARLTGARVHMQHLSTAGSVEMVRAAKRDGVDVTAEVTPHHLVLTDERCAGFDPIFKVNPPLRTAADIQAVRAGLIDGTIDAVATDHAPHPVWAKEQPFDLAPPGMLGLEVALAVVWTELGSDLGWAGIVDRMSVRPAAIAGMSDQGGSVAVGDVANLSVFDPQATWVVDASDTASLSRNNPWADRTLTGRVRHTIVAGKPVVEDGNLL